MSSIFLSHAVVDTTLAKLLVDFLMEAIGVPHDEIFCSSVEGHGVPMTKNFNEYMKEKIQKPKLVLLLMTPSYMESAFCLMELGAAWAQSHVTLPIVVPPLSFGEVTKTLGLVQAWDITKQPGLIELRKTVNETKIKLEKRSDHVWENKKADWRKTSRKIIAKLPTVSKVSVSEFKSAVKTIEKNEDKINKLETLLESKNKLVETLKTVKDAVAVKAILKEASGHEDPNEVFDELINDVRTALPSAFKIVNRHLIMDHYDKASKIDWFNDRQEFEDAIKRNLIDKDDESVSWNRPKLNKLRKSLQALDHFIGGNDGQAFLETEHTGVEVDDLEFWEHYL